MGLRSHVAWLRHGPARTDAQLAALGDDLRQLQERVQALADTVDRLGSASDDRIGTMQRQLRAVTDDLGDRVGAMSARLDSLS